jgi:hypothetical protein
MRRPEITEDQREIVVVMLANAMRKDAHLRARASRRRDQASPLHEAMAKRRSEPSQRYVEGMRDLLRVLFTNGHAVAEECLEEATARAIGVSPPARSTSDNGKQYH